MHILLKKCAVWIQKRISWDTIPWVIGLALFVMPFFWYAPGEGDFGGDASRLFFYDPVNYLRFTFTNTMSTINLPPIYWAPLVAFFAAIRALVGPDPSLLIAVVTGVLFATGFAAVYLIIGELLEEEGKPRVLAGVLAGLFFVLSQIVAYNVYRYIPSFHGIAVYPIIIWLLLKYLRTGRLRLVVYASLISLVFSINFAFDTAPAWSAFGLLGGMLFFAVAVSRKQLKRALMGVALFGFSALCFQAFHWFPQIAALFERSSIAHTLIFDAAGKFDRGLKYFQGNRPWVRLIYNVVGFHQYHLYTNVGASAATITNVYEYGVKYLRLFALVPLTVVAGVLLQTRDTSRRRRLVFFAALGVFTVATFLMTANLFGGLGVALYEKLFIVPGFSMFRSFYGVFSVPFVFIYALIVGMSAYYVFVRLQNTRAAVAFAGIMGAVLVFGALPMIDGRIVNQVQDQTDGVRVSHKIPASYERMLAAARDSGLSAAVLSLPLNSFDYQMVAGEHGGAYVGPAPFMLLAGRSTYGGFGTFDYPGSGPFRQEYLREKIRARDYRTLSRAFSLMNVGLVIENRDPSTYLDAFKGWPYLQEVRDTLPDLASVANVAHGVGRASVLSDGAYTLYHDAESFMPVIAVPRTLEEYADTASFGKRLEQSAYDPRTAFFLPLDETRSMFKSLPHQIVLVPTIEFRQVTSNAYRIRVRSAQGPFPLVLSRAFHPRWELRTVEPFAIPCSGTPVHQTSAIGAASSELVNQWCEAKRISTLGADFISREYQGSIQNQNMPARSLASWWNNASEAGVQVPVNNFANAWLIDPRALGAQKNADGSYDMEFELLFMPFRSVYIGVAISVVSLIVTLGVWITWIVRARRNNHPV